MVILLTGKLSQGGYILSSVGFKWVPYNKDFPLYYRGMEVQVGGNRFRLYMATVFGVTFFNFLL